MNISGFQSKHCVTKIYLSSDGFMKNKHLHLSKQMGLIN